MHASLEGSLKDERNYNVISEKTFKEKKVDFSYIALLPPDINELENRLRKRGADNEDAIKKRIDYAVKEIELINGCKFLNFVINNGDLDKSFNEFEKCIKILNENNLDVDCHFKGISKKQVELKIFEITARI